jgi:membrane-bound inhibitor of C-type lysozyme
MKGRDTVRFDNRSPSAARLRPHAPRRFARWPFGALTVAAMLATILGACSGAPSKADEEAARNTVACQAAGERIVIRFDQGEVRLLLPGGERVTLYPVPSAAGPRYTNGSIDLFGKGSNMQLARDGGAPAPLQGCEPLAPPRP